MFNCEINKTLEDKYQFQFWEFMYLNKLKLVTIFCVNRGAENKTQRNPCVTLSDNFLTADASPPSFFGEVSLSVCHQRRMPGYHRVTLLPLYSWPSHP